MIHDSLLWFFKGDCHNNPQHIVYSTVYQALLRLSSKAASAQLSSSLIKY